MMYFTSISVSTTETFFYLKKKKKKKKNKLCIAALDVQKTFDVVNHESLLCKLYHNGISGDDWLLLEDMHTNMKATIYPGQFVNDKIGCFSLLSY